MNEWDEPNGDGEEEADPGFLGGGGVAETSEGDGDAELDEHGDGLTRVEEED